MKRTIHLKESELKRMIAESVKRVLRENLMDDISFMVERKRYGEFWLRDINSWIEFNANAWIENGKVMCSVDSEDKRGSQMCNSQSFNDMCASAILQEYPQNIDGFQEFVEEIGDYDEAINELENSLENHADTYTAYNRRVKQNIKDSGDASSLRFL
jgi:hypothetical protein